MLPRIIEELPPRPELPTHGLFKNLEGKRFGYLLVYQYIGKINDRYSYACICDCGKKYVIGNSTSLGKSLKSCGCYQFKRIREANTGNDRGSFNKTSLTAKIEKLRSIHPEYTVVDSINGLVMEIWEFYCNSCEMTFSARYDNIVGSGIRKPQKPCKCGYRGGFNYKEKGYFYILQIEDSYLKFGITNETERRWKQLEKEYKNCGLLMCLHFEPGREVEVIEKIIKLVFKVSKRVKSKFPSRKEIRDLSVYHEILQLCMYLRREDEETLNKMYKSIRKLEGKMV